MTSGKLPVRRLKETHRSDTVGGVVTPQNRNEVHVAHTRASLPARHAPARVHPHDGGISGVLHARGELFVAVKRLGDHLVSEGAAGQYLGGNWVIG